MGITTTHTVRCDFAYCGSEAETETPTSAPKGWIGLYRERYVVFPGLGSQSRPDLVYCPAHRGLVDGSTVT